VVRRARREQVHPCPDPNSTLDPRQRTRGGRGGALGSEDLVVRRARREQVHAVAQDQPRGRRRPRARPLIGEVLVCQPATLRGSVANSHRHCDLSQRWLAQCLTTVDAREKS